ncbi:MAG: carbon-nitrogen hydrolase family protein [Pseudomonadota bacterium]
MTLKLALYQCPSPAGDIELGLSVVDRALARAAAEGVDMLVLPEMFLPGYNVAPDVARDSWDGIIGRVRALVAEHQIGLTIGLSEFDGNQTYNGAITYGPDGTPLAKYRKVQLFGPREASLFQPGTRLTTFDFKGTKCALLICYDVEFPEHTRALAQAGAEVILVPTANMEPFRNVNETTVPARALETGLTIVYANYIGPEGDLDYVGRSAIIGPDGVALAEAGTSTGMIVADLPDKSAADFITPLSTQLQDLRPVEGIDHHGAA